jgi:hypothetical protein
LIIEAGELYSSLILHGSGGLSPHTGTTFYLQFRRT